MGHRCSEQSAIKPWNFVGSLDLQPGTVCAVPADASIVLGRGSDCDVQVASNGVARSHVRVELAKGGQALLVTDLKSTNGTTVNGQLVEETVVARVGDAVVLAGYFDFEVVQCPEEE